MAQDRCQWTGGEVSCRCSSGRLDIPADGRGFFLPAQSLPLVEVGALVAEGAVVPLAGSSQVSVVGKVRPGRPDQTDGASK